MEKRLPRFGVGPVYIALILMLTIFAVYIGRLRFFSIGTIPELRIPMLIIGVLFLILGVTLWVQAVVVSRMRRNVDETRLITTGVYVWVRNPLYSGYTFIFSGFLCMENNLFLMAFPFLYWLILSIIVRKEETALEETFGEEYHSYKSKVNRCIPWFPR